MTERPRHTIFQQTWPEGEFRFFQMGFVVDDLVATAHRWAEVHGVGPFHVLPAREVEYIHRGEPSTIDMQVAVAQAGPVQIELIHQRDDRPSVFRGFPPNGSCGFHQICTVVTDYAATIEAYARHGHPVACEFPGSRSAPSVAYIDTLADLGFFTEIVESTPAFLQQLAAISETCAAWDGTDPVRELTRDGYRPL